jgi:hypothetical protein
MAKVTVEKISLLKAVEIVLAQKGEGTFFTVEFIKRSTGELRVMNCRGGVAKYVKGVGMSYDPSKKGLVPVWEANNAEGDKAEAAYRMISAEGIKAVTAGGIRYEVEQKA